MATATTPARPPFPPFTRDSAMQKVRLAEARAPEGGPFLDPVERRWRACRGSDFRARQRLTQTAAQAAE